MNTLFVIPCRFDPQNAVIFECVDRLHQHHPDAEVLVVDSDSPDRSYFDGLSDVTIADIHNTQYGVGAFAHAYRNFDADFYYLIYDSLMVNAPLHQFEQEELTTIRHWRGGAHRWGFWPDGTDLAFWGAAQLERIGIPWNPGNDNYVGMMGPMWFCPRHVLEELDELGYWEINVPSKIELCGMERLTGIALQYLGYSPSHSLQGEHTYHSDPKYDTRFVTKLDLGRM